MRMHPIEMITVLPTQFLQGQWKECLMIKGAIDKHGTPNHRLVNKVLNYNIAEFKEYCGIVAKELLSRKRKDGTPVRIDLNKLKAIQDWDSPHFSTQPYNNELFKDWHTVRYLKQCVYNLQEKYDCYAMSSDDWQKICKHLYHTTILD